MKIKPIFSSSAASIAIDGDRSVPVKSSFGSVSLLWRRDGLLITNGTSCNIKAQVSQTEIQIDGNQLIPWPAENKEEIIRISDSATSEIIVSVAVSWTERIDQWNSYRNKITDKGELYQVEIADKYELIMNLAGGSLEESSLNSMMGIFEELGVMYKNAYITRNIYNEISSHWKSEIYAYCVRLLSQENISEELSTRCADFIISCKRQ